MSSIIDYEELECEVCGSVGVIPNGDYDVVCPTCGAKYSLLEEEENKEDSE